MQVRRSRKSGAADVADDVSAFNLLSFLDNEVVHVGIARPVTEAVVDFHHFTVSAEADTHVGYRSVSSRVYGCADAGREVNTRVHLFHFVHGVNTQSETG